MDEENSILCEDYLRVWSGKADENDMAETYFNELVGTYNWRPERVLHFTENKI